MHSVSVRLFSPQPRLAMLRTIYLIVFKGKKVWVCQDKSIVFLKKKR